MKWTKDKPTEPGWYWTRIDPEKDDRTIDYWYEADLYEETAPYEWSGPIPEPTDAE